MSDPDRGSRRLGERSRFQCEEMEFYYTAKNRQVWVKHRKRNTQSQLIRGRVGLLLWNSSWILNNNNNNNKSVFLSSIMAPCCSEHKNTMTRRDSKTYKMKLRDWSRQSSSVCSLAAGLSSRGSNTKSAILHVTATWPFMSKKSQNQSLDGVYFVYVFLNIDNVC